MKIIFLISSLIFFVTTVGGITGCGKRQQEVIIEPVESMLFVGNSFTSSNGGLNELMGLIASSMDPLSEMVTTATTMDGATLEVLWKKSTANAMIQSGRYNVVVLQGDIPEGSVASFNEYARKFAAATKEAGARPILLIGWAYDRLDWINQNGINTVHSLVAQDMDIEVAPVGKAWSRVLAERPDIDLYANDREHPSNLGSYLTICVIYATVMGKSPEGAGIPSHMTDVTEGEARYLQRVAWDTSAKT